MTSKHLKRTGAWLGLVLMALCLVRQAAAFPPAPHHTIYGLVRDQIGNPLAVSNATVTLATTAGTRLTVAILPGMAPGKNFQIEVPMDAGLTSDAYAPTALLPAVPFTLTVQIGQVSYVPMEMKGGYAALGQPGGRTELDLTLGVDSDGDGLPDAWEMAISQMVAGNPGLAGITPGGLMPGTGLTYFQVYVSGIYNYSPQAGFVLKMLKIDAGAPVLEFTAVKGRNYTIQASSDMKSWQPVAFRLYGSPETPSASYQTSVTKKIQVQVAAPEIPADWQFFNLVVQ